MGVNYQLDRAWINTCKGISQCQKADKVISKGNTESAASHFDKALGYFGTAVDHLVKAENEADIKAGKLLEAGNHQLQSAVEQFSAGNDSSAVNHYESALDKYDEAFDLID